MKKSRIKLLVVQSVLLASSLFSVVSNAELQPEKIPNVQTLPAQYPDTWLFAHDDSFYSLLTGKIVIVDVAADTHEYKGAIGAAQFASFIESSTNGELYVGETFYSRGTRGTRTEVVSIYDKATLDKTSEIILPKNNRGKIVANKYMMRLVDNDRYLLIFGFTPASSVMVIDTQSKKILNDISVPGCSMIYPTGKRGFSSLCGNGSMVSVQFDEQGVESHRSITESFFNVDDDPLFDKPEFIGSTAYFVSYKGKVQPIDFSQSEPKVLASWSLVSEKQAKKNWRPSGWQVVTSDNDKQLYVIMGENGFNGSHKSGGEQIWVADVDQQKVVKQIKTKTNAFSIEYVVSDKPLLTVTNTNMALDVYSPAGKMQRSIVLSDTAMPLILHAKR